MSRKRPPHQKDRRDQRPGPPRDPDARREAPPAFQGRRQERHGTPKVPADVALIWGYHAVREALRSERRKILRIMATDAAAEKLAGEIAAKNLRAELVSPEQIAQRLPQDAVHQGVLVEARHLPDLDLEDLPENGFILVLDQVTDPHNVGAILRSAAAFGVAAVILPERHAPAASAVMAKAASGAMERVPLVRVVNLARALDQLKAANVWCVGLAGDAPQVLGQADLTGRIALVLGSEGEGLRRLTRERCDMLVRIPMAQEAVESLNVSNAAAVALYEIARRRG